MRLSLLMGAMLLVSGLAWPARGEEIPSLEKAAQCAQAGVATVRVLNQVNDDESDEAEARPRVTVCTGVCVEKGWIVTPAFAGTDSQIRLTLAGGEQSQARLRVIDEYSGLALLEADTKSLEPLLPAEKPPKVGAWVVSAAAWGVEPAVVSFGILSGEQRAAGGMQYPPLMQADLRTTETSSGAALVDSQGGLLGIVVLADKGEDRRGWTYAVPVSHVQRLLRVRSEQAALDKPMSGGSPSDEVSRDRRVSEIGASVVVLKRRRPVVGMVLDGIGERVVVQRVEKGSPAEKAGLKVGDIVRGVDGVKIRSVTQAVMFVLKKQPGDIVVYDVLQDDQPRQVEVVLGGGVELSTAPGSVLTEYIQPKVDLEARGGGRYYSKTGSSEVREVYAADDDAERSASPGDRAQRAQQIEVLEKALDRYRKVIEYQQQQLGEEKNQRRAIADRVRQLEMELQQLQKRETSPPAAAPQAAPKP